MKSKKEITVPIYVSLDGTCLKYYEHQNVYYRHAGEWSVQFIFIDHLLYSWSPQHKLLHRQLLTEVTEEQWRESNKGYID